MTEKAMNTMREEKMRKLLMKTILAPVVILAVQGPQQHGPVNMRHHIVLLTTDTWDNT